MSRKGVKKATTRLKRKKGPKYKRRTEERNGKKDSIKKKNSEGVRKINYPRERERRDRQT